MLHKCVSSLFIVYIPGTPLPQAPKAPKAPMATKAPKAPRDSKASKDSKASRDSKDLKASKAPRWELGLTEECEMKNCAAGEYVAVTQARRSNL